jgi:hypothetical protein
MASIDFLENDELKVSAHWCDRDDEADFSITVGDFCLCFSMLEAKEIRRVLEQKLPRNMSFSQ